MANIKALISRTWMAGLLGSVLSISACSTEVETNADYEEVPIIYCLLNKQDKTHYVRLQKGFQNQDADATQLAKIQDSSTYEPAQVDLTLQANINGQNQVIGQFEARPASKQEGDFFDGEYQVYALDASLSPSPNATYWLTFNNRQTGNSYQSERIRLIDSVQILVPLPTKEYSINNRFFNIQRVVGGDREAESMSLVAYGSYLESINGVDTVRKEIAWPVFQEKDDILGQGDFEVITEASLYTYMLDNINTSEDTEQTFRILDSTLTLELQAAGNDYRVYRNLNGQYSSITQTQTIYTNIEGGLGLFSTRYFYRKQYIINAISFNNAIEDDNPLRFKRLPQ